MEAYRSSTRDDALAAALSLEMPKTCDLFATALQGLWLWVLFLAFLFRGLCARSAAPRPASLLPAHNYRTVAALCIVLVQVVSFADVIWRFHRSAEPHVLLIPAAGLTLASSLATAAFYHATERWCAPGYVWVCLWVWIFQVGLGMWRVWQIARSGMQMILVYPCLTIANTVVAAFILSLDLYTVMLWTYRQRRCEVLEITPGLDDAATLGSAPSDADSTGKGEGNTGNANTTGGITYAHPRCSLPSRATFLWFLRVLKLGWKRPLEFTDLGKLPREEEANYQYERFHRCYNEQKMNAATSRTLRGHEVSLWRVFFLVYWREMLAGGILKFLGDSVNYVGPLAISAIVIYVSSVQEGQRRPEGVVRDGLYYVGWQELVTNGWVVACMALAASLAQSTFSQASTHLLAMEGIHVKAALQGMVYHKSLRLPSTSAAEPNSPHDEREGEDTRHKRGGSNSSSSSSTVGGRNTSSTESSETSASGTTASGATTVSERATSGSEGTTTSGKTTTSGTTTSGATTQSTSTECKPAPDDVAKEIFDLNKDLGELQLEIEITTTQLVNCSEDAGKIQEVKILSSNLEALVSELNNIITKLEGLQGGRRRFLLSSSILSMLNSAGIQSDAECTLTAESLLTSIRNMERMLTSLQSSHMADRTQDELACTARKMLAAFSNVATGTATLTENEKEEVQLILNNLSQHKFKELSKSLAESQKSKEALKRSLESHLEDLASRKRQVEDALAVAKSR